MLQKQKKGKILSSIDFVGSLSDPEMFRYDYHGHVNFKNILESKEIVEILPQHKTDTIEKHLCPVCHMRLDAYETDIQYTHDDETFYFCSEECTDIFQKHEMYNLSLAV